MPNRETQISSIMEPEHPACTKKQPWMDFQSKFGSSGAHLITYHSPKGAKLKIAGTSGELCLDVLYDTEKVEGK